MEPQNEFGKNVADEERDDQVHASEDHDDVTAGGSESELVRDIQENLLRGDHTMIAPKLLRHNMCAVSYTHLTLPTILLV